MKKILKIIGTVLLATLLAVYVCVALLNYSVVQSVICSVVGQRLSAQWGGKVKIGSLHADPFNHLIANNLLIVAPDGDTVLDAGRLRVQFDGFPMEKRHLKLRTVVLRDAYYHLASWEAADSTAPDYVRRSPAFAEKGGTNLQHILDRIGPMKGGGGDFTIDLKTAILWKVHYRMDIPDQRPVVYDHGVQIPHMELCDISAKVTNLHVVNDDVTCRLARLKAREASGFELLDATGDVHVGRDDITVGRFMAKTAGSTVKGDVEIVYDGWESLADYVHTANHNVTLHEGTTVALADAAYWAPMLWGIDMQLDPVGTFRGTVDSMHTEDISLRFGNASEVAVDGSLTHLLEPDKLHADFDNITLRFEQSDLRRVCAMMPQYITPDIEHWLREVEYIDLMANAHGGLKSEATVGVNLVCGLGNLRADARTVPVRGGRRVLLDMGSDGMGLTPIGSEWLTHSGFSLNAEATLPDNLKNLEAIDAEAEATLTGCVVRRNLLQPIDITASMHNGKADFNLQCADTLLAVDISGSARLADSVRFYLADIDIAGFQADTFGLVGPELGRMSSQITASLQGNSIEELCGGLLARNTHIGAAHVKELTLNVESYNGHKSIHLLGDALTADINGWFRYADLPVMAQHVGYAVLPADLLLVAQPDSAALEEIAGNSLSGELLWTDNGSLLRALAPGIGVARGTRVNFTYNPDRLLHIVARGDSVRIGSLLLAGVGVNGESLGGSYVFSVESSQIDVGALELIDDAVVNLTTDQQDAELQLVWGDSTQTSHGDLVLGLADGTVSVLKPYFYIGDSQWELGLDSLHFTTGAASTIAGSGIRLNSGQHSIEGSLQLFGKENDYAELNFDQFGIGLFSDLFLQETPIDVSGALNGRFTVYGLSTAPYFNTKLGIDDCFINRQPLGDLSLILNWNPEFENLSVLLDGSTLYANGNVDMGGNEPSLNFSVDFDSFELATIAPFLTDITSLFEGALHGEFDIEGPLRNPTIRGAARVEGGALRVDATNVTYYFNDSILFTNNLITLDNFKLHDNLINEATIDGTIGYHGLDNINIDLSLHTDNLLVLNSRSGEDFFGTVLVKADGTVRGTTDNININVKASTNDGSSLTVPISDRKQIVEQDFIEFVGAPKEGVTENRKSRESTSKFSINADLTLSDNLQLNLPMTFSEVTVDVNSNGDGDMHLTLNESLEPNVTGKYEINSGTLKFRASIYSNELKLDQGSSIEFLGDLADARFDLKAFRRNNVNLSTLTGNQSDVGTSQKKVEVESIIKVSGTITDPTLGFDIRADRNVEEEVFSYIDRNNERDMINQTLSLLLLGHFYNENSSLADNDLIGNGLSSGYSMVASTMGSIVSDMVSFVDVDFNYKAATELTNQQVDMNINKDFGRLYFESTLGYGGDSRMMETTDNNAVIDALVGFRVTPMFHIYAYNRTNNNDYTRTDLPYRQGLGLKLTKDFDHFGDLFSRKKKKKQQ